MILSRKIHQNNISSAFFVILRLYDSIKAKKSF